MKNKIILLFLCILVLSGCTTMRKIALTMGSAGAGYNGNAEMVKYYAQEMRKIEREEKLESVKIANDTLIDEDFPNGAPVLVYMSNEYTNLKYYLDYNLNKSVRIYSENIINEFNNEEVKNIKTLLSTYTSDFKHFVIQLPFIIDKNYIIFVFCKNVDKNTNIEAIYFARVLK